jgi:hypothetical protein
MAGMFDDPDLNRLLLSKFDHADLNVMAAYLGRELDKIRAEFSGRFQRDVVALRDRLETKIGELHVELAAEKAAVEELRGELMVKVAEVDALRAALHARLERPQP